MFPPHSDGPRAAPTSPNLPIFRRSRGTNRVRRSKQARCWRLASTYLGKPWRQRVEVQWGILLDSLAARELSRIPSPAQCLDQRGTGDEPALPDVDGRLGGGQRGLIGDDDAGIRDGARQILVVDDPCGLECRGHGLVLDLGLLSENAQGRELVLDLLERSQNGLPVIGHVLVKDCAGLLDLGAARAGVEYRLYKVRAECPEAARGRQ